MRRIRHTAESGVVGTPRRPGGLARLDGGEAKLGPPRRPRGLARLDGGEAKLGPPREPRDSRHTRYRLIWHTPRRPLTLRRI
ncbi:hypothetical protein BST10_12490 [Mycolicibacter algericus DSM 45454]|uniref:Uncharacterized protein n=1 Tax=Mycolicibacter algericus DSM 45454 TaxID=723879 RepID=A0ABX3RQA2_MYCAL|nr:hypothetical protein BST10_12490 [Mycolicibacter algericus DSM 45454]